MFQLRFLIAFLFFLLGMKLYPVVAAPKTITVTGEVYFSPDRGAAAAVVQAIDNAHKDVYMAMYGFTHPQIVAALKRAEARGVQVYGILDRMLTGDKQNQTTQTLAMLELNAAGGEIRPSALHRQMHDKFAIIDAQTVITGSMNWTKNGDNNNQENLLILHSPELAQLYLAEWRTIK